MRPPMSQLLPSTDQTINVLEKAERIIRRYAAILNPRECSDALIQLGVRQLLWEIDDVLKAAGRRK